MSGRRHQHESDSRPRTEPTLGRLDQLDAPRAPAADGLPQVSVEARPRHGKAPPAATRPAARSRRGSWLLALLAVVMVLVAALWIFQGPLRTLLPRTDFDGVLVRAQAALQAGHLDGHDGTSARELYQAALALEPDNDRARDGLHQVGQAELSKADAALQAGHLDEAKQRAAEARELLGGGSDIDHLDHAIAMAGDAKVKTSDLVDQAQQALSGGKLVGDNSAGALYQRVLQMDPGNAVAMHGLDQVGDALATQAHKALDGNDLKAASASIQQLAALQPNNDALPALRAQQAQVQKQDSAALDDALTQGDAALRAGRIGGAGGDTALAHFKAALALDPDNAQARSGLGKVAQALTVQANAAIDAGDKLQARQLLDQAATLAPKSADLAAARARLGSDTSTAASGDTGAPDGGAAHVADDDGVVPSAPATLTPQQQAKIAAMVKQAQVAAAHGQIMLPPGTSAYDLYRSALAIDGNNAAALAGLQNLPSLVEQRFNQALKSGDLTGANESLNNLSDLAPGAAVEGALTNRLAMAWLDQADQQLGKGDRAGARQSLEQARKLAPNHPRVQDLAARLQSGG